MDIHSGVIVLIIFSVIGSYFAIRAAIRAMQAARKISFYSLRRRQNASAIRFVFLFVFLIFFAFWLPTYGEPAIYVYFPPSPTPSLTPTITVTPTISMTPTITLTPTLTSTPLVTDTPTLTATPSLPLAIESFFEGPVTPNPDAVFTAIQFSTNFDGINPINPRTVFELPVQKMYGGFDYNNTIPGVQWTALWYHEGKLICFETKPWDGGTGGIGGYTECSDPIDGWLPGNYEVQIFMGYDWKVVGRFVILGTASTMTPQATVTSTSTPTP
jgi:hypothetical protein